MTAMERPEKTGLNRLRRRSSILKPISLAADNLKDGPNTTTNFTRLQRRVSFAETIELKNYCREETGLFEGAPERCQVKDAEHTSPVPPIEQNEWSHIFSPDGCYNLNASMYIEQPMEQASYVENALLFQVPRNLNDRTVNEQVEMSISMSRLEASRYGQSDMEIEVSRSSVQITHQSVVYTGMDISEPNNHHDQSIGVTQMDLSAILHALSPGVQTRSHTQADVSVDQFVMEEEMMAQQERQDEEQRTSLESLLETVHNSSPEKSQEDQADMDISQMPQSSPQVADTSVFRADTESPEKPSQGMDISHMPTSSPAVIPQVNVADTENASPELAPKEDAADHDVFYSPEGTPQKTSQESHADMDISQFAQRSPDAIFQSQHQPLDTSTHQTVEQSPERHSQNSFQDMEISQMPKITPGTNSQWDFDDMDISQKPFSNEPGNSSEVGDEEGISQALRKSLEKVSQEYLANMSISQALKISPVKDASDTPSEVESPADTFPQTLQTSSCTDAHTSLEEPLPDMDISHFLKASPSGIVLRDALLPEKSQEMSASVPREGGGEEEDIGDEQAVDMEMSTQPTKGSRETMADMSMSHILKVSPSRLSQHYRDHTADASPFHDAPLDLSLAKNYHEDDMDITQAVKFSPAEAVANMSLSHILKVSPRISQAGFADMSLSQPQTNEHSPQTQDIQENTIATQGEIPQENPLDMTMTKTSLKNIHPQISQEDTFNATLSQTFKVSPASRKTLQMFEVSPVKVSQEEAADMSISDTGSETDKGGPSTVQSDSTFESSFDHLLGQTGTTYTTKLSSPYSTLSQESNSADKTFASSPKNENWTVTKMQPGTFEKHSRTQLNDAMEKDSKGISDVSMVSMWNTMNSSTYANLSENSRVDYSPEDFVQKLDLTMTDSPKREVLKAAEADTTFDNLSVTRLVDEDKVRAMYGMAKGIVFNGDQTFCSPASQRAAYPGLEQTVLSPYTAEDTSVTDASVISSISDSHTSDANVQDLLQKKVALSPIRSESNPVQKGLHFFQKLTEQNQTPSKMIVGRPTEETPKRRPMPFTPSKTSSPLSDKTFVASVTPVSVHERVIELEKTILSIDGMNGSQADTSSDSDDEEERYENDFVKAIHQQLIRLVAYGIVEPQGTGRWTITIPGGRTVLALLIKIPLTIRDISQATSQISCQAKMLSGNISQKKLDFEIEHVPRSPLYLMDLVCALRTLQRTEEAAIVPRPLTMRPPPVLNW